MDEQIARCAWCGSGTAYFATLPPQYHCNNVACLGSLTTYRGVEDWNGAQRAILAQRRKDFEAGRTGVDLRWAYYDFDDYITKGLVEANRG